MHERHITCIRESYRPARRSGTVTMPLLMAAILVALSVFYFKGRPSPPEETSTADAPAAIAEAFVPEVVEEAETKVIADVEAPEPPPTVSPVAPSVAEPIPVPDPSPREVERPGLSESDFTPWMTPLVLDTYIRQKNRGHRGGFWTRGNWIRAIEGRWREGEREFRIALGTMDRPGEIDWNYRLDLTEAAFAEALTRFGSQGYALVQSQAYRHPDGALRYQAVWQRDDPGGGAGN